MIKHETCMLLNVINIFRIVWFHLRSMPSSKWTWNSPCTCIVLDTSWLPFHRSNMLVRLYWTMALSKIPNHDEPRQGFQLQCVSRRKNVQIARIESPLGAFNVPNLLRMRHTAKKRHTTGHRVTGKCHNFLKEDTPEPSNLYEAGHPLLSRIRSKWRAVLPKDKHVKKPILQSGIDRTYVHVKISDNIRHMRQSQSHRNTWGSMTCGVWDSWYWLLFNGRDIAGS